MPPKLGDTHRRPRSDSGAVRLWAWARACRGSWTAAAAAEAAGITARRARAIVAALREAGLVAQTSAAVSLGAEGAAPAEYRLTDEGRALAGAPIMIIEDGAIRGVRLPAEGAGNARLVAAVAAAGISQRAAAAALGVHERTLRRMLAGETPVDDDDPVMGRLGALKG